MRPTITTTFVWLVACASLALFAQSLRSTRASIDELPVIAWRGAPLRASALVDPTAEVTEAPPPPALVDGAYELDLARLTFDDYDAPELRGDATPLTAAAYPEAIRAYDGAEIVVSGYAQPLAFEEGRVVRLRLTRFPPGCCFGALPQYDEWIAVELGERGSFGYDAYSELRVRGRLELGEAFDELGGLESLYRLADARAEE